MEQEAPPRNEFRTGDYYIDGDLAHLIGCVKEWGDFATFREASEKVARLLNQAPVATLIVGDYTGPFWALPADVTLTVDHLPEPNGSSLRTERDSDHSED